MDVTKVLAVPPRYLGTSRRNIAALGHMQHDDSTKNMTIVLDSIETNRRRRGKGSPIPGE